MMSNKTAYFIQRWRTKRVYCGINQKNLMPIFKSAGEFTRYNVRPKLFSSEMTARAHMKKLTAIINALAPLSQQMSDESLFIGSFKLPKK